MWITGQTGGSEVFIKYVEDERTGEGKVCVLDLVTHALHCEQRTDKPRDKFIYIYN